jgi:hypothetical protein
VSKALTTVCKFAKSQNITVIDTFYSYCVT